MNEKRRMQLLLSERSVRRLEKLKKKTELPSDAAVIRRAIELYGFLIDEPGEAFIRNKDGTVTRLVLLEKEGKE